MIEATPERIAIVEDAMEEPIANIFDIDGTCSKRQLLVEFELLVGELHAERRPIVQPILDALATYTNERTYDYGPVISTAVEILPEFFRGLRVDDALAAARIIIKRHGRMTYRFPRKLLGALRGRPIAKRGPIIAVSAGPDFLEVPFCELHGFDLVYATPYEAKDGVFTGERDERTVHRKGEVLEEIVQALGLDLEECLAVGDTTGDIPMLDRVGYPFVVNPKGKLLEWVRHHDRVVWVSDNQATGVTLFSPRITMQTPFGSTATIRGRFIEVDQVDVLPGHVPHVSFRED